MNRFSSFPFGGNCRFAAAALLLLVGAVAAQAHVVQTKGPQVGSTNPVSAEPLVSRPHTKPCKVVLFNSLEFADFSSKAFSYTPPADCPGPWAKVVFTADFTVTAGIQYDRTAEFFLGHANIFYGTTAEPGPSLSPSWHVERDLTDLSQIFTSRQTGEADLGNLVDSTYTGIIYANAVLEFYPVTDQYPAPLVPDVVVPVPDAAGGAVTLSSTASLLTQTVTLPTNVERAYFDVIAQSQNQDEFWYTCVPNDVTGPLESCGGTPFRETEVSIDGTPAGVAPIYPWIYTGGLDPYLWTPIVGVQTLNFQPYRVDLTPFAGLLSDGSPHTVSIGVFNSNNYFLVTGNLLVFTDHGKDVVTGAVTKNTLTAAPVPVIDENLNLDSNGFGTATVKVGSARKFAISGYVNTSHGKITTTVAQDVEFLSTEKFTLGATTYVQDIAQASSVDTVTTKTTTQGKTISKTHVAYPLNLDIVLNYNADGSGVQTVTSEQHLQSQTDKHGVDGKVFAFGDDTVKATDSLDFDPNFNITGESGEKSSASDLQFNTGGEHYYLGLKAKTGALTTINTKPPCD